MVRLWRTHSTLTRLIGSTWEYDETTEEYYLHLFASKQPDLNWDNPDVREAIWKMMRFWLDKGCDGFRVSWLRFGHFSNPDLVALKLDAINHISKVEGLPDAPVVIPSSPYQPGYAFFIDGYVHPT